MDLKNNGASRPGSHLRPFSAALLRFASATGMPPLDYIHALRLEEAKQILETEDLPIEAVALEIGYQDNGFFGQLFRRKVGMTAAQYRRKWRNLRTLLRRQEWGR